MHPVRHGPRTMFRYPRLTSKTSLCIFSPLNIFEACSHISPLYPSFRLVKLLCRRLHNPEFHPTMSIPTTTPLRILISGAGIAGPVCAYWLRQSHPNASITIIERAPALRKEGQTIDVAFEGRRIFDAMGITDTVMKYTTKEKGIDFIDKDGGVWGHFPQEQDGGSFTREIEIVRGELARILYEVTKDTVDYVFDESITAIHQDDMEVEVDFRNGTKGKYDLLIIADGLSSRTRAMAFSQDVREPIKSLDEYIAGFSLAVDKTKDGDWAKWYNPPGRRVILHRPDGFGRMRSNFVHIDYSPQTRLVCSSKTPVDQQKEYWAQLFKGAGWDSERLIQGMKDADDFYVYEVAQVKMKSWSKGRVVMIGDAASCPSPISGQGTNVAITQAYTLAAMITQYSDHTIAFKKYEDDLRPWVEGIQKLPPGAPRLAVPETEWGVRVLLWMTYLAGLVVRTGWVGIISKWLGGEDKGHPLQPAEVFESGRR